MLCLYDPYELILGVLQRLCAFEPFSDCFVRQSMAVEFHGWIDEAVVLEGRSHHQCRPEDPSSFEGKIVLLDLEREKKPGRRSKECAPSAPVSFRAARMLDWPRAIAAVLGPEILGLHGPQPT